MPREPTCGSCRFFNSVHRECCRYPPVLAGNDWRHPQVTHLTDPCGEHKKLPEQPKTKGKKP